MPRLFNVEGELTVGKRIKCSHEIDTLSEAEFCHRTHEVAVSQPDTVHVFNDDVTFNGNEYRLSFTGYIDASGWYIQKTEPMLLGRSEMLRTYYIAYCPYHIPEEARRRIALRNAANIPAGESGISIDFTSEVPELTPTSENPFVFQQDENPVPVITDPFYEGEDVLNESDRACDNCYYNANSRSDGNSHCPRFRNCDGYSMRNSNWVQSTDYNGRQARIDWMIQQNNIEPTPDRRRCSICYWDNRRCPGRCDGYTYENEDSFWTWNRLTEEQANAHVERINAARERLRVEREEREARESIERAAREAVRYTTGIWCHHSKGGRL